MTLREAAQNVVDVWNRYGTAESLRGWMEILEKELTQMNKCDRCGKVTREGDVHTCSPRHDEQEPVAIALHIGTKQGIKWICRVDDGAPLYTHPTRRLTDEVIADLWHKNGTYHHHFARAVERWLKGE